MNTPQDDLSPLLHEWKVRPSIDPQFRHQVWQRLEGTAALGWAAYLRQHALGWSGTAMLVIVLAAWSGHRAAQETIDAQREARAVAYLIELDPRVQATLRH